MNISRKRLILIPEALASTLQVPRWRRFVPGVPICRDPQRFRAIRSTTRRDSRASRAAGRLLPGDGAAGAGQVTGPQGIARGEDGDALVRRGT